MTVKELRKILKAYDDNSLVVIAKDAEGNDFSPLRFVDHDQYTAENSYSGCIGVGQPCVVLWPMN